MSDLAGNNVALIVVDSVYDRTGSQVGWWYGDHISNRKGQVALFVAGSKIHGLAMPVQKQLPSAPKSRLPVKPNLERLAIKPRKKYEWADVASLQIEDRAEQILSQLDRALAVARSLR